MDKDISDNEIQEIVKELRKSRQIGTYSKSWYKDRDRPVLEIDFEGGLNEEILDIFDRHSLKLISSIYAGNFMTHYRFQRPPWLTNTKSVNVNI